MSNEEKTAFKTAIKMACVAIIAKRCINAELAMQQAQDSANNQEKSSAGDKYETSRAMGQHDRDMNARQLQEAQKDMSSLNQVTTTLVHTTATTGAVIVVGEIIFFVSIGLGPVKVGDTTIMVISNRSPVFEQLKNKKAGDAIIFQDKKQLLNDVF